MNRSPGITASAVVAILGSLGVGVMAAFMIFGGLMLAFGPPIPNTPTPYSATMLGAIVAVEVILFLGFAIFGIVSAIGLLRLKNWARISFLVFAVILAFCAGSSIFAGAMMVVAMPAIRPPNQDVPPGLLTGMAVVMIVVAMLLGALATWWLIYFSRRRVKAEFMGEAAAAVPRRGPLSITIIAWLLAVGAVLMVPLMFVSNYPGVLMGMIIEGWPARAFYLLWAACALVAGIGLLTWRRWAHSMAIGLYTFALLNTVLSLVTGAMFRVQEIIQQRMMPTTPYPVFPTSALFQFSMIFALVFTVVVFWLLLSRRRAFLAACDATAPAPAAG